jgi:hypothetical protein
MVALENLLVKGHRAAEGVAREVRLGSAMFATLAVQVSFP